LLLASATLLSGFVLGIIQSDPSPDLIGLILGPLGAVVVLVLVAWYFAKRDKEKEQRIQAMQDSIIKSKDDQIERLRKQLNEK
jgi:mannitol-specific phosphotransferase system IIBC component